MPTEPLGSPLCLLCRRAAEAGLICWSHRDSLAEVLNPRERGQAFVKPGERRVAPSIPVLYGLLSAQRGVHGPMAVGTSAFGPRSPGNDDVLVLRDPRSRAAISGPDDRERAPDAPLAVLGNLASRTYVDRGRPEREPAWTVKGLSSYLHAHVDYIAGRTWAGTAHAALRALHSSLRAAANDPPPRPVGPCWVLVDDHGREDPAGAWRCATPLYMPEQPPRAPDEPLQLPTLRCTGCGHRYTGAELVQLGQLVEREAS